MSLLIEQLTTEVEKTAEVETTTEVEKTAEEAQMEKLAQEINTLDQSRTLIAVGEEMYKIAEELGNENLVALAVDTYQLGERMGSCLTKTASDSDAAIVEALEIAEDMHKVASVYAEIADDVQDEEFSKLAAAIIDVANEMTDEVNEVCEALEEVEKEPEEEGVEKEANVMTDKTKAIWKYMKDKGMAAGKSTKEAFTGKDIKTYLNKTTEKAIGKSGHGEGLASKVKSLLTHKQGLKATAPAAVAYGGAAAALGAAGYGAKKLHDKK